MARPQTYTDSEITRAIQALMAEGGPVNPMRVKRRLGGGNVSRIKVLLAKTPRPSKKNGRLPADLMRALEGLVQETMLQAKKLAEHHGAKENATSAGNPAAARGAAQRRIAELESELARSRQYIAQLETQQTQDRQAIATHAKEQAAAAEATSRLHSALRNAESDLRAAQRIVDTFERSQRQDREDIRRLQTHNESLATELATLKARKEPVRKRSRA